MKTISLLLLLVFASIQALSQKEYYVTSADQTKIRVREFGSGKPIVILAGGPGLNVVYMQPVWEHMQKHFRCIVVDQRGTGQSPVAKVDSASMSMENYINDLEAIRKQLGESQLTLVGHSWGGMLAMEYAAFKPQSVSKLVLIGSGGPTRKFFAWFGDNLKMRLHDSDRRELAILDSLHKPSLSGVWPGYFYDRDVALAVKATVDFTNIMGQPGINPNTIGSYITHEEQRVTLLKDYHGAVVIIQGRQDPVGESTYYEIKSLMPQTQLNIIEKCGHMPWFEKEDRQVIFYNLLEKALE